MRKPIALFFILSLCHAGKTSAQGIDRIIDPAAVESIEKVLSADSMQGRASFSPGIEKAADFIEGQFRAAGLQPWDKGNSYRQPFVMISAKLLSQSGQLNKQPLDSQHLILFSSSARLTIDDQSGYGKAFITPGPGFFMEALRYIQGDKNLVVFVDSSLSTQFGRLRELAQQQFSSDRNVLFVLAAGIADDYSFSFEQQIVKELKLANVAGILPGKSRASEYVIFSAHYDHLGTGLPDDKGDSVFNGANDDASGCTAVIMLAWYFAKMHDNERTLIFVTFVAEEIGGFGSRYFSGRFDPARVAAMFNIEMIGTESKWGPNSAYITGFDKTDMGKILQRNLAGSLFAFYPDPYPQQSLFYRSDNATLARLGVPAHTLSTSKMDSEKYYHTRGDEIGTLDMQNMARIIKSIALSSRTIIKGTDTPTRVNTEQLK